MKDWQHDKSWSDRFLPEIKAILGEHLIGAAPESEDQERNTDLIVLGMSAVRIACRIRRFDAWQKWPDEFTIRCDRPSGAETELTKILRGWGDYLFYGFADEKGRYLHAWTLGDLSEFRIWLNRRLVKCNGELPGNVMPNHDGSSRFRAFKIDELPPAFVVGRGAPGKLKVA